MFEADDPDISEEDQKFTFREHQIYFYEKSKDQNSIVFLETGTGKTIIAIMLIWHHLTKYPGKKVKIKFWLLILILGCIYRKHLESCRAAKESNYQIFTENQCETQERLPKITQNTV